MTKSMVFGIVLVVAGCADPMTHSDGIWPGAGAAQLRNLSSQAVVSDGRGSLPGGNGVRAAEVIRQYQTGGPAPVPVASAAPASPDL